MNTSQSHEHTNKVTGTPDIALDYAYIGNERK